MVEIAVNQELLGDEEQQVEPGALPVGVYPVGEEIPGDRAKLFEANGRQYTAPKKINHKVVFRYLRAVHHDDSEEATADLMYAVLGEGIMDVLADEDLTDEQYDQVMKVVRKHTMGATEATLGNSRNGRRR